MATTPAAEPIINILPPVPAENAIKCHNGLSIGSENIPRIFARFGYLSIWDIWYRFKVFHIEFYDLETGERLLEAGQYGDNVISNEQEVIDDTLEEIRKKFNP